MVRVALACEDGECSGVEERREVEVCEVQVGSAEEVEIWVLEEGKLLAEVWEGGIVETGSWDFRVENSWLVERWLCVLEEGRSWAEA